MTRVSFTAPDYRGNILTGVGNPVGDTDAVNKAWALANGGATILTGVLPPTPVTGTGGNYYLDTVGRTLYGPKAMSNDLPPASWYGPADTPATTNNGPVTDWQFAQDYNFAMGGTITAIRYYRSPTVSAGITTTTMKIYSSAGALLATTVTSGESGAGWKEAALGTPLGVTLGQRVRVAIENAGSRPYSQTTTIPTPVSGNITMGNMYFATSLGAYPTQDNSQNRAFVDVVYIATLANPWPVALNSVPSGGSAAHVLAKASATDFNTAWAALPNSSYLIKGTAAPLSGVGVAGNYYIDTDDNILYGPRAVGTTGADEYISSLTWSTSQASYGGHYGLKYRFLKNGIVTGIRFYYGSGTGIQMNIYSVAGALLKTVTVDSGTANSWNTVLFSTPLDVQPGATYVVSQAISSGATRTLGSASGITEGNVRLLANGEDGIQPVWSASGFPSTDPGGGANIVTISPIFQANDPWPKAFVGGGVKILTGTAVPGVGTGTEGDYYLDTDDHTLFGPKVGAYGAQQSAFTSQTPGTSSSPAQIILGVNITCAKDGRIVGLRYHRHASNTATSSTMNLWTSAGVLLGTCITAGETSSGWKSATFSTPIAVTAGQVVRAAWDGTTGHRWQYTTPAIGAVTNGDLTVANGMYYLTPASSLFPTSYDSSSTAYVDVLYEAVSGTIWPKALQSGTTVLTGTATPVEGIGAQGDYYLDSDDHVLYGPKQVYVAPPTQSVYTSQTGSSGGSYQNALGVDVQFAVAGRITGLRYYRPAEATGTTTKTMRVWSSSGVLLGSCTTSGDTGSGWKSALLTPPIEVTAAQTVRIVQEATSSVPTAGTSSGTLVNQDLTMTGQFAGTSDTYPTTTSGNRYMVDLFFVSGPAGVDPWPVAVSGAAPAEIEVYVQEEPPGAGTVPLLWMDVDDLSLEPEGGELARGAPPVVQIYVSPEEPTDPEEGSLWVDTS